MRLQLSKSKFSRYENSKSSRDRSRSGTGSKDKLEGHITRMEMLSRINHHDHKQFKKARDFAYKFVGGTENKWFPSKEYLSTLATTSEDAFLSTFESAKNLKSSKCKLSRANLKTAKPLNIKPNGKVSKERLVSALNKDKSKEKPKNRNVQTAKTVLARGTLDENRPLHTDGTVNTFSSTHRRFPSLRNKNNEGKVFKAPPRYLKSHEPPLMNLSSEYYFKNIRNYENSKNGGKGYGSVISYAWHIFPELYR